LTGTEPITTSIARSGGVVVLAVGGEIDLMTGAALEAAIDDALGGPVTALIVDLSTVEFLGSVGLRILAATHEQLSNSAQFAVVADGPATTRPIRLTKLDEVFAMYPMVEDAMEALRAPAD
jgi:anti-sigma B factor antagonist